MNLLSKVLEHEIKTGKKVKLVTISKEYYNQISKNVIEIEEKLVSDDGDFLGFEGIPFEVIEDQLEDYIIK